MGRGGRRWEGRISTRQGKRWAGGRISWEGRPRSTKGLQHGDAECEQDNASLHLVGALRCGLGMREVSKRGLPDAAVLMLRGRNVG